MKVAIIVPNTGMVHHNTVSCISALAYRAGKDGIPLTYYSPSLAGVAAVRNVGAEVALDDKEVTHILWIDSDMTFPSDALNRLLAHDKYIVGCAYPKRDGSGTIVGSGPDGRQWTELPEGELVEAGVLGFGFMLTRREVYALRPYFLEPYVEGHGAVSEDAYFLLETAKDFDVWCDTTLSREVGHLGITEYKL